MIKIENLTAGYGKKEVIKDFSIEIKKGEMISIIGPNGVGKSTLLNTVRNEIKAIRGKVLFKKDNGEFTDIKDLKDNERARLIAQVSTEKIRSEMLLSREVVELGRYPYTNRFGVLSDEDKRIVDLAIDRVGARDLLDKEFIRMSDGEKQIIMLARAIAQEPQVLILDEPTSYLDIRYKIRIMKVLKKLVSEKEICCIMSLHELELARYISDRILSVNRDGTIENKDIDHTFNEENIKNLYDLSEEDLAIYKEIYR
ncbi:MAG: ABC transporter ATP-binding protein [Eubacterium sp.]|nr:ABC transporter ATP-binding protein [Eubacterium sp.]